jgi:hypothetical protein
VTFLLALPLAVPLAVAVPVPLAVAPRVYKNRKQPLLEAVNNILDIITISFCYLLKHY